MFDQILDRSARTGKITAGSGKGPAGRRWLAGLCLACLLLALSACGGGKEAGFLVSVTSLTFFDGETAAAEREILAELNRLELLLDPALEGSDLWRVNQAKAGEKLELSSDFWAVYDLAAGLAVLTDEAFSPALYPLTLLWGFGGETRVPAREEIDSTLADCGMAQFSAVTEDGVRKLIKKRSGAMLDFGGVAKGYAADRAGEIARARGVTSGMIDIGGNHLFLGDKGGRPFRVGVTDPRSAENRNALFGVVSLTEISAVSSGDFQRYFEADGVRYCHILDAQTGAPAQSGLCMTFVLDPVSARADALSTALFVMGLERGAAFCLEQDIPAILIEEGRYWTNLEVEEVFASYTRYEIGD